MAPSGSLAKGVAVRDVDKLLAVTDGKLAEDGKAYMVRRTHGRRTQHVEDKAHIL